MTAAELVFTKNRSLCNLGTSVKADYFGSVFKCKMISKSSQFVAFNKKLNIGMVGLCLYRERKVYTN